MEAIDWKSGEELPVNCYQAFVGELNTQRLNMGMYSWAPEEKEPLEDLR